MVHTPTMPEVRRQTIRLLKFEDGLWDLLLGIIVLMLAFYPVTRARLGTEWNLALFLAVLALVVLGYFYIRRIISTPRLGYAQTRWTPAVRAFLGITITLVLLTLALLVLTLIGSGTAEPAEAVTDPGSRSYLVEIVVLIVLAALFSGMAYVFHVPRLYLYGWLFGGGNLLSVIINQNAPERFNLPMAVAAAVFILVGVYLFRRFLTTYPSAGQEAFGMEA